MKVVVALDSFKGSIDSLTAGNEVKYGILNVFSDADIVIKQIADGGEGTDRVLTSELNGATITLDVVGPLGNSGDLITCNYGVSESKNTAIIEMASASGLPLVKEEDRNPLYTTTYGVGEMIKDAVIRGYRNFIIGIGGSSTNDCGLGMLTALGFKFLDINGNSVGIFGIDLKDVKYIDDKNALPELKECKFLVACDVKNPLCGPNGCSYVYAPQKGADAKTVEDMDKWIFDFASLTKSKYPDSDMNYPGSGAAGGLGFAFRSFLNAELKPGIDIVIDAINLDEEIRNCDYVITGEGAIDNQSLQGKVISGVASASKKYGKPVIALAGAVKCDMGLLKKAGIDAAFSIHREILTLEEAMNKEKTCLDIRETTEMIFRTIALTGG